MTDDFNPYASPLTPPERVENHDPRVLQGWFTADDTMQQFAAEQFRRWQKKQAGFCVLPPVVAMIALQILMQVSAATENAVYMVVGFALLIASAVGSIVLHFYLKRTAIDRNYAQQTAHPVVGANGLWQLTMDLNQITLHTPGGSQSWPAEQARYTAFPNKPLMLWLEPDLVIVLPANGDYGEDSYLSMGRTVCERVKHWNFK